MRNLKTIVSILLCLIAGQTLMAQNDYFVSTNEEKLDTSATEEAQGASAEARFLNKNFPFRSMCDWTTGMRFMVIPGEEDKYRNTFMDDSTNEEIPTGKLKHKILIYQSYSITDRNWLHFNFVVDDSTHRKVYHEVRNFEFSEYCQKQSGGGVATLAYLGDVDKARELLIGKTLYSNTEIFYKDAASSLSGSRESPLSIDTKLKVTGVGVGTREYPVKIVVEDEKGQKYFALCTMSHINCGMNDNDFIGRNEQHLFDNAFRFTQKYKNADDKRRADPTKNFSALPETGPTSPRNSKYVNYAGCVSGMVERGNTKQMVRLAKGSPAQSWRNKNGTTTWKYDDGMEVTFNRKGVAIRVKDF